MYGCLRSVHSPSELFQPPSSAGDVSGELGQEGTAVGDQDEEPGILGHHRLDPLIRHIRHAVTDVELLQWTHKLDSLLHFCTSIQGFFLGGGGGGGVPQFTPQRREGSKDSKAYTVSLYSKRSGRPGHFEWFFIANGWNLVQQAGKYSNVIWLAKQATLFVAVKPPCSASKGGVEMWVMWWCHNDDQRDHVWYMWYVVSLVSVQGRRGRYGRYGFGCTTF